MNAIDTKVEGDAAAVGAVSRWIRRLISQGTTRANDIAVEAKRESYSLWEGGAADQYRESLTKLYEKTDSFEPSITRAAELVDDYGVELTRVKNAMEHIRARATEGNLVVHAELIQEPAGPGVPADLLPGFEYHGDDPLERERLAGEYAAALRRLYHELAGDVQRNRTAFHDWIETNLGAMVSHLGGDDLLGLKGELGPLGRFGVDFGVNFAKEGFGAAKGIGKVPKDIFEIGDAGIELGRGAYDSARTGDPSELAKAGSSTAISQGVDAVVDLGEKGPWSVAAVALGKTVLETGSDAAIDSAVDDPELPPRPPHQGAPYRP